MKKIALISFMATSFLFALILLLNPQTVSGSKKYVTGGAEITLPDSVLKFVQKACMDCHADDGSFMAKGKVNFSVWNNYDSEKQIGKAKSISKVLTKGTMPPKKWRTSNPDNVPTQAEVNMISRWANGLQK
ncbi:MAG: heme-binding domain-containing protein [Bacteroidota bacterium]